MLDINLNPFPVIQTERLILRQMELADADNLFLLRKEKKVMQYIAKPLATSIMDAIDLINLINQRIETNAGINWAITLKDENKLVGSVSLHKIDKEHHRAELGYMLSPHLWNKRITSEAVNAVINYGFDKLNLHSIEALIDPDNIASAKILKSFGFKKEAYFKQNYFFNEKFLDTEVYSLLKSDWLNNK